MNNDTNEPIDDADGGLDEARDANTCSPEGADRPDRRSRRNALNRCERAIRRYEESSLEAGTALKEIDEEEHWELDGYASFADYVGATCTFDLPRARQLIRGAVSLEILTAADVAPLPTNEAQVRPLATHAHDVQVRAWNAAVAETADGRAPTMRIVRRVTDEVTGRSARRAAGDTRDWTREAVRRVARLDEPVRSAVVARINADVERVRELSEADRDEFDGAVAGGPTVELVDLFAEAHLAEVAESGIDHDPVLAGSARPGATPTEEPEDDPESEARPESVDGEVETDEVRLVTTTRDRRTLIIPGVAQPLLVELPRPLVPASLLDGVPRAARAVIVEIGELERRGGPVDDGVLRCHEIRDAARALGLVCVMNETNEHVDWARWTTNPLTGCLHACADVFCYAASIANRLFAQRFTPTLYPVRLDHFAQTRLPDVSALTRDEDCRHRSVFCTSMGDLFGAWVPSWYVELVLEEVRQNQGWFVFFLTKNSRRLRDFTFPPNCAVGVTITGEDRYLRNCDGHYHRHSPTEGEQLAYYRNVAADMAAVEGAAFTWLSLEPFRSEVYTLQPFFEAGVAMVAVGGQSRTAVCPAEQPDYRWVERVRNEVRAAGAMFFEKENQQARSKEIPFPADWLSS